MYQLQGPVERTGPTPRKHRTSMVVPAPAGTHGLTHRKPFQSLIEKDFSFAPLCFLMSRGENRFGSFLKASVSSVGNSQFVAGQRRRAWIL